jgi:hypothetical protein
MSLRSSLTSARAQRRLLWIGSAVVAVAVAAGLVLALGTTTNTTADVVSDEPAVIVNGGAKAPLPRAARKVAGEFILTTVTRKDLARGWEITHPSLREGMTKQEWLKGDIPIVPYPVSTTDTAPMSVEESYKDHAIMRVALSAEKGTNVKPQLFFIGVRKFHGQWRVDYWGPYATVPVPSASAS